MKNHHILGPIIALFLLFSNISNAQSAFGFRLHGAVNGNALLDGNFAFQQAGAEFAIGSFLFGGEATLYGQPDVDITKFSPVNGAELGNTTILQGVLGVHIVKGLSLTATYSLREGSYREAQYVGGRLRYSGMLGNRILFEMGGSYNHLLSQEVIPTYPALEESMLNFNAKLGVRIVDGFIIFGGLNHLMPESTTDWTVGVMYAFGNSGGGSTSKGCPSGWLPKDMDQSRVKNRTPRKYRPRYN